VSNSRAILRISLAALLIMGAAVFASAQEVPGGKRNERTEQASQVTPKREPDKKPTDNAKYSYEFNQPEFYIRHIFIEHDAAGNGRITFERKNEEAPFDEPVAISPAALTRILGLWQALQFLDSTENYQSAKQFPHLGTMKLHMTRDDRNRTVEFNWTNNRDAAELVKEYRRIADQTVFVFDISIARENQPLNAPKLMEGLEAMLNRGDLSDPNQLVPLLHEISSDEHIPLIARNHALRILKKIQK